MEYKVLGKSEIGIEKQYHSVGRDAAHNKVNEVQEQFSLLKSVPIIFFIIDKYGNIVDANDYTNNFFSYAIPTGSSKLSGILVEKLFEKDLCIQCLIEEAFNNEVASKEVRIPSDTEKSIWIEMHLTAIHREKGNLADTLLVTAVDISAKKETEALLKQNESTLNQIYGEVPVMIYAIDDQAVLRHANKKLLEKTGYDRDEVIGKKIKVFLTEDSKQIVFGEVIPELIKTGKVLNREVQLIMKNGEFMDVRFSAVQSTDAKGHFLGLVVVEDITEVKRTQESLIETDEQYRKLIQGLPDVVTVTDIFGNVEYVSPNGYLLPIKKEVGELIGSHILTWIDVNFHDTFLDNIQNLIDGQQYVVGVYDFLTDDKPIHIEVRSTLIHDAHGKPRGCISILRDITKSKKAEEELLLKEQILQKISENSADIIWMMDTSDNITFVSKATQKILGYTPEEASKMSISALQSEEDFEKKKRAHRGKFPVKRLPGQLFDPVHLEIQHFHKNGSKIWTDMLTSPLYDENDTFCGLIGIIRDNSERKANELAIRESQELYRSLIELSPEGIIIIKKGNIEFANREFVKMLKVEHESQLVAHKFLDLVMMKDHAKVRAWLKNVEQFKTNGEVILAELKRFNGTPLIAEVMATPITIRGEKSAQLFVRDVTLRMLTEKELNKERELNENLIKSIPDYIYFKDCSGKFIKINRSFSKALGLSSPDQAVGKTDKHYFGIKHFQHTQKEEKQIVQTKKPLIGTIRKESWPTNNGQWVSVTKMPLFGPDREVIGTFGVSRDITKQRQSEEELRRREERFRHFFGQVQVGVAIVNSSFEVLEVNNAFCSISNYSKKELIDTQFLRFFNAEQGTEIKKQLGRIKANQAEHYQTECKLFLKDGNAIYVIFQLLGLDASNERKDQFLCQIVDINDRMIAEEQLLIRNNELNNFVYKVSHDLRAPLLSVKGLINLMRIEKDPALYDSYVGMIEERVEKLDGFIRDILSHSKNLNTEVITEEIDLKEVIENCFEQMQFFTKSIDIEKKVAVKGSMFFSDAQRIQEILRNLISNAVIYSSKERKQSFVHVNVRSDLKKCTIIVEDNGIGIKKIYLDKIFQMFYRANDKVEGSGIGLYIVQQSVLKLGGQVHVESKLNSGTRFTLTIPNNLPKKKLN